MTVRRILDMLDVCIEEHKKGARGHELSVERLNRLRQEIVKACDEAIQARQRSKRKEKPANA